MKKHSFKAKRMGIIIALLLTVAIGLVSLKLISMADDDGIGKWVDEAFSINVNSTPLAADNTIEIPIAGGVANSHPTETFHVVVAFFSDSNRVEYVSSECIPPIACTDSNWRGYAFGPMNLQDARVTDKVLCITVPPNTNHLNLAVAMKMRYKVLDSSRPYWFDNITGVGRGSCASNPAGSNIITTGGNGSCINYVKELHPGGCIGSQGIGARGNNPFGNFPDPNPGSQQGRSPQQGTSSAPGAGSGGGGSLAATPGDSSNSVPMSSDQGDSEQPKVEPSPFFDGKLFAAGSDASDIDTVKVGGLKLGYGWLYLLGGLVAAGVAGFFGWKWWQGHRKK